MKMVENYRPPLRTPNKEFIDVKYFNKMESMKVSGKVNVTWKTFTNSQITFSLINKTRLVTENFDYHPIGIQRVDEVN